MQYLHLLSNTASISPSDTWKLSDSYLKPESGDQIAAGYYRVLNKNKIEISAEVYYKWGWITWSISRAGPTLL